MEKIDVRYVVCIVKTPMSSSIDIYSVVKHLTEKRTRHLSSSYSEGSLWVFKDRYDFIPDLKIPCAGFDISNRTLIPAWSYCDRSNSTSRWIVHPVSRCWIARLKAGGTHALHTPIN
jgi:hypothetical protein